MSEPSTADIIAALHGDRDAIAKVRGTRYGSWARTDEGIAAADRLAELDAEVKTERQARYEWSRKATESEAALFNQNALRPPCPTCGGTTAVTESVGDIEKVHTCPDCPPDGKVSIEQLVATYNAVHTAVGNATPNQQTLLNYLRSVKP